jgi:hypothetical protein
MTSVFAMLSEEDILLELKQYQNWHQAYMEGKRREERPGLPENKDAPKYTSYALFGTFIHMLLFLAIEISGFLRIQKFVGFFSRLRISTDRFCYEPVSCGYNSAYTKLGLALLSQNDVVGAIRCLETSWRVHPCPHNTSFGLKRSLVSKLKGYPEASKAVAQYIEIGKQFVSWSEEWVERINKS